MTHPKVHHNGARIRLLGVPVDNLTLQESLEQIEQFIATRRPHQHVVVNVDKLIKARSDANLLRILEACDLINADGQPVVWAAKLLGLPLKERVTGIQLMAELLRLSAAKGYRPYFLGAKAEVLEAALRNVRTMHPALQLAGWRNGYWTAEQEEDVVAAIRNSAPDVLFVGISSPRKEQFLHRHLQRLGVPFVMGVGGSFDVLAGRVRRAPAWMQRCGLEWAWRLGQEPRRMWRRYLVDDAVFPWLVLREWMRKAKTGGSAGTAALPGADAS